MGPPLISGGNGIGIDAGNLHGDASMGPPLISGGNVRQALWSVIALAASMGPPLISGGNEVMVSEGLATKTLQWGRR